MPCSTMRRRPRAACWRPSSRAPSSISPRCSASASRRASRPTPSPRPRVVQVTKALAVELAFKGVRVNAIAPGWFVTEINDKYLMGEAGDALKRAIPMGRFGNDGRSRRRAAAACLRRRQLHHRRHHRGRWRTGGDDFRVRETVHGLHAVARDRSHPPARARFRRGARAAARSRSGQFRRSREHPVGAACARCARKPKRPACGRRRRPRNTAAWDCRSWPGRRSTRRRRARSSVRWRSIAWRRTTAT